MIQDIAFFPAVIGIIALFYFLPGFFIARLFQLPSGGLLGLVLSLFTGFVIMPFIYTLGFILFGFTTWSVWIISLGVTASLFIINRTCKTRSFSVPVFLSRKTAIISTLLISCIMLLFLYAYPMVQDAQGIWHTVIITDTDKHYMVTTSLLSSEHFPPGVSYSQLTVPSPLRYYYFYYLIVASIITALGFAPHIPTVFAIVSSISIGLVLCLFAALATYFFKRKTAAVFAVLIGYLSGFEFPYLLYQYLQGKTLMWSSGEDDQAGIVLKLFQAGIDTTPQHFFASGIFILIVSFIAFSGKKSLLFIILPILHAISFMFSLHQFAAITLAMSLYAFYFLWKMRAEAIGPILGYMLLLGLCYAPLGFLMNRAGDPMPLSSVIILTQVPIFTSPVFGAIRNVSNLFLWLLWYVSFFIERFGVLLIFGILGIWSWRKKLFAEPALVLLSCILVTTYISVHVLKLPGPQNEYSKNATLFITYALGIFAAGWLSMFFEKARKQFRIKTLIVCLLLLLSLATGLWEYYWAVLHQKVVNSKDIQFGQLYKTREFIRNKTPRDSVFFTSYTNSWFVSNAAARRINFSPLSMWSVWIGGTIAEHGREEVTMQVFKTGTFNRKLWGKLYRWHTDYILLTADDPIYSKRNTLVDKQFFKEIYHDKSAVIYEVMKYSSTTNAEL